LPPIVQPSSIAVSTGLRVVADTLEISNTITEVDRGASNAGASATLVRGAAEKQSRQAGQLTVEVGAFIAGVTAA
jgi:hypothetical protein